MTIGPTDPIQKRAIFYIGGFDPKSADAFFTKVARESKRFESLWGTKVEATDISPLSQDISKVCYHTKVLSPAASSQEEQWQCQTDFHFLSLDDVVLNDFKDPLYQRITRYGVAFADYLTSRTAGQFVKHAWRFSIYFFYPAVMFILLCLVSLIGGLFITQLGFPLAFLVGTLASLVLFIIGLKFIGKRYYVLHLMDLWSFSRNYLHHKRPDMEEKLEGFSNIIAQAITKNSYDEIIMVGHSTGGALILDAAGRVFENHPECAESKTPVHVLTVGSTALKIGLHPAAQWFRTRVATLLKVPNLHWNEYQCMSDIINFYRTNPAQLMGIEHPDKPIVKSIRLKNMLDGGVYKRIKRNFFRVHYQFVFGNTKPYHYDFMGICMGPLSLRQRAQTPVHDTPYLFGKKTT